MEKLFKKDTPHRYMLEMCKANNIPSTYFNMWQRHMGTRPITKELVDEFNNRPHMLYQLDMKVNLSLPEKVYEQMGFSSVQKQLKVDVYCYVASKGVVFKETLNNASDLRIRWDEITGASGSGKFVRIVCDDTVYNCRFNDKRLAGMFYQYVSSHMCGCVEDGWE